MAVPLERQLSKASCSVTGRLAAKVVGEAKRKALIENVKETVEAGSTVFTDEAAAYYEMLKEYDHQVINHAECYVEGNVHTNEIENFWSLLKRGIERYLRFG